MDIRSLTIDGQRLRIGIRVGVPRLPPLIVFNGIGASLELIEPFVSALPEREVVAFDVPGSGGSPASLLPYRFPGLARLAHRLLGELLDCKLHVPDGSAVRAHCLLLTRADEPWSSSRNR